MLSREDVTTIERLRVHGARDALATRLRVESLLGAVDLRPSWLPPSAVLLVRSLRVQSSALERSLDVAALRSWERALRSEVDRVARRAARPAREAVPADAEAVLFDDHAEMLVCMARDLLDGTLSERWWWTRMSRTGASRQAVPKAWREAPEHVPGALEALARSGDATRFVEALQVEDVRALLHQVLDTFGLPSLRTALAKVGERAVDTREDTSANRAPPWRESHAERATSPLSEALLAVCILLVRAPSRVRNEAFAAATQRWAVTPLEDDAPTDAPTARLTRPIDRSVAYETTDGALSDRSGAAQLDRTAPYDRSEPARHTDARGVIEAPELVSAPRREGAAPAPAMPVEHAASEALVEEPMRGVRPGSPEAADATDELDGSRDGGRVEAASGETKPTAPRHEARRAAATEAREETTDEAPRAQTIETALGGVFFLVYVGISLGLYGDFSTPREPGIALPIWDWLALVGRALLPEGYDDDPLWALLARLAERSPGVAPGEGFEAPDGWALPEAWTADDIEVATTGERAIERWIASIAPHVRARLASALGVERSEVAGVLLLRRARVRATTSHLDVTMSLADLPIEVRRSGIDRDVGWVPAAGRYVAFQFE